MCGKLPEGIGGYGGRGAGAQTRPPPGRVQGSEPTAEGKRARGHGVRSWPPELAAMVLSAVRRAGRINDDPMWDNLGRGRRRS